MNDPLYRPVQDDDPDIQALADSIKENGVLEPLVASKDGFIISGHRRKAACEMALVWEVPCVTVPITMDDPRFMKLLREFNRQRSKGFEEIIAEAMVDANGEVEDIAQNLMIERSPGQRLKLTPWRSRSTSRGPRSREIAPCWMLPLR